MRRLWSGVAIVFALACAVPAALAAVPPDYGFQWASGVAAGKLWATVAKVGVAILVAAILVVAAFVP